MAVNVLKALANNVAELDDLEKLTAEAKTKAWNPHQFPSSTFQLLCLVESTPLSLEQRIGGQTTNDRSLILTWVLI